MISNSFFKCVRQVMRLAGQWLWSSRSMAALLLLIGGAEILPAQYFPDPLLRPVFGYRDTYGPPRSYPVALQPDGKIIVIGEFAMVNEAARTFIARLNTDGTTDPDFQPHIETRYFEALGNWSSSYLYCAALQPDGKILIGGSFTTVGGKPRKNIARLNADGSLDESFDLGRGIEGSYVSVKVLALQNDGKVIAAWDGYSTSISGMPRTNIARFNANGTLDSIFDPGIGGYLEIKCLVLLTNGQIIVGGSFKNFGGVARKALARLDNNGRLDLTYDPGAIFDDTYYVGVSSLAVQPDGKLLVGGLFRTFFPEIRNICRFDGQGHRDAGFGDVGTEWQVSVIRDAPDGTILLGGYFYWVDGFPQFGLARLGNDGRVDTNFTPRAGWSFGVVIQPDGKIVSGGGTSDANGAIDLPRFEQTGMLDHTFRPQLTWRGFVDSALKDPDGRLLAWGNFNSINGLPLSNLVRIAASGALDDTFRPAVQNLYAVTLQEDGDLIIGGGFQFVNGLTRSNLARLKTDGTLNTSFTAQIDGTVYSAIGQSDGRMLVGGTFRVVNAVTTSPLVRLNADGSLDGSFAVSVAGAGGTNIAVRAIAAKTDGTVFVGGVFTRLNGLTRNYIGALDADGSTLTTFDAGTGPDDAVSAIVLQNDGKLLLGGAFSTLSGVNYNGFARLNTDGALDTTFRPEVDAHVGTFALEHDGKIWIYVQRTREGGGDILRLNPDGTIDRSVESMTLNGVVSAIMPMQDGSLLVTGSFSEITASTRVSMARLIPVPRLLGVSKGSTDSIQLRLSGAEGQQATVEASSDLGGWTAVATGIVQNYFLNVSDRDSLGADKRFYRAVFRP